MLCEKNENELTILKQIPCLLNHYTTSRIPPLVYITDKDLKSVSTNIHTGITVPASKIICTVIDAGEKGNISKSLFNAFFSYINHGTEEIDSTIYAYLLSRTHDKNGIYHRYLFTFSPIPKTL